MILSLLFLAASNAWISRNSKKIILGGFVYTFRTFYEKTQKAHFSCEKYQTQSCKAAIVHHRDIESIDLPTIPHNHPAETSDVNTQNDYLIRTQIRQYAVEENSKDPEESIIRGLIANFQSDQTYLVTKIPHYVQVLRRQRNKQKLNHALEVKSIEIISILKVLKFSNSQIGHKAEPNC